MSSKKNICSVLWARTIGGLVLTAATFFLCNGTARAEGYGDYFLYDLAKLPKNVLVDTIGLAVLNAELTEDSTLLPQPAQKITRFLSYDRKGDQFVPAKEIPVAKTLPVGVGGYGGWVKYLVTAWQGEYLQIITDPYKNLRTWIRPDKAKGDYAIIFADLINSNSAIIKSAIMEEEIDIFLLSAETKLYAEPRPGSKFKVLRKANFHDKEYYPIAFTKDYIQVGLREMDPNDPHHVITVDGEPLGWIKMRDDQGRIAFHLFMASWN